jgi:hypothetical protein
VLSVDQATAPDGALGLGALPQLLNVVELLTVTLPALTDDG